jgi:hypothetical protein
MMSPQVIRQFQREAAERAAEREQEPLMIYPEDVDLIKAAVEIGEVPNIRIPNLGDYVPDGWERVLDYNDEHVTYFCDKSGMGASDEPALTLGQFLSKLEAGFGYAMIEEGQFQCYVGKFQRTEG